MIDLEKTILKSGIVFDRGELHMGIMIYQPKPK